MNNNGMEGPNKPNFLCFGKNAPKYEAFYRISKAPLRDDIRVKLIELLARDGGTYGMVLGQAIDLYFENRELTIDEVKFLHKNKTAKLIATSLLMGATIVDMDRGRAGELYSFGLI